MENILGTARFYLRKFRVEDAEQFYRLNLDEEVIRYTGDTAFDSVEAARQFLLGYDHYAKYGFGRWAVINRETGEFTGWCGLKYHEQHEEVDVGYRFFKRYWNQGYATETAMACIEYGFASLQMSAIVARAMKANTASIRVMEKIGMSYLSDIGFNQSEGVIYIIRNKE